MATGELDDRQKLLAVFVCVGRWVFCRDEVNHLCKAGDRIHWAHEISYLRRVAVDGMGKAQYQFTNKGIDYINGD